MKKTKRQNKNPQPANLRLVFVVNWGSGREKIFLGAARELKRPKTRRGGEKKRRDTLLLLPPPPSCNHTYPYQDMETPRAKLSKMTRSSHQTKSILLFPYPCFTIQRNQSHPCRKKLNFPLPKKEKKEIPWSRVILTRETSRVFGGLASQSNLLF